MYFKRVVLTLFSHTRVLSLLLSQPILTLIAGYASVKDAEGNAFEGSFVDWNKHGKGKLQSSNGETYNGEWANGLRQGYGILTRPDGSRFEGVFDNSK